MRALAISLSVGLVLFAPSFSTAAADSTCREVQLEHRPAWWASSGAWTEGGDLLLVDAASKEILRYSKWGRSLGTLPEPLNSSLRDIFPQTIKSAPGSLFIEVAGGDLIPLDKELRPQGRREFHAKGRPGTGRPTISALQMWNPVGVGEIFALADLKGPRENDRQTAWIRLPLNGSGDYSILKVVAGDLRSINPYLLAHPYAAALGVTAYSLLFDDGLQLLSDSPQGAKQRVAVEPIRGLPRELELRPILPLLQERADIVPIMDAVESSTMVTGLYPAGDDALVLLWRRPERGVTRWYLTKVDPVRRAAVATVALGISAHHLTVVPGPQNWAFIVKGPVRGWGIQDADSIVFVPWEKLQSAFKPSRIATLCQ